jgi:hypothetical protein
LYYYIQANLSLLLTDEEMKTLIEVFDQMDSDHGMNAETSVESK